MGQNGSLLGPFWALLGPREPSKAGGNWPRAAKSGSKGHRNVFWDRFRPFGCHFSAFRAETENRFFSILRPFWVLFGSFLGPFGPLLGPREPSKARGNWPRADKRGSKCHINVFWDRFRPFGCYFSAFRAETENRNFFDFEAILGHFGSFLGPFGSLLGPFGASGALKGTGELAKSGQKGVKRP